MAGNSSNNNRNSNSNRDSNNNSIDDASASSSSSARATTKKESRMMGVFSCLLAVDVFISVTLITHFIPGLDRWLDTRVSTTTHFTLYSSLQDVALLAAMRVAACVGGIFVAYCRGEVTPEHDFPTTHPNGDKKSREELEQEALEEDVWPWLVRFLKRPCLPAEFLALVTQLLCVIKCLVRLQIELSAYPSQHAMHPLFWIMVLLVAVLATIEACYLESICNLAAARGKEQRGRRQQQRREGRSFLRTISSTLSIPLLGGVEEDENGDAHENENNNSNNDDDQPDVEADPDAEVRAVSDIGADANYKATWKDLLMVCAPDLHLLACAFCFLLLAAIAQVYIPRFLGNILDSLEQTFDTGQDDDATRRKTMMEVPGFIRNVKLLVAASIAAGVFSGLRGSIFTVVGARVNVRLREHLMDALLSQDIGFFDMTKTGDITSRLSSDTTLVGDQVSLNVNVFLRSLVQAVGVLLFCFFVSWQLSILAFISVPIITVLSKWYGNFLRKLTKLMQKKLADGNIVSEAALSSMSTVRSFDAAEAEFEDFQENMKKYLKLNERSAIAYCGYAAFTTSLPQLVFALVVFYGGLLVRNGDLTGGALVSFLLYLQSLSDAFATLGWVFSALTQAVGAADKVFELMHRKPGYTAPTTTSAAARRDANNAASVGHTLRGKACKVREQRTSGLRPETAKGEIELENVVMYYPARPQRRILDGLSLKVEAGSVVALVGKSGGGKSSVMSLIQHLYEQSSGKVLIDGREVHDLCPEWLSRNISIVSQEPILFARSIKRNIMYGLEGTDMEPSDEEIQHAARLANAHSFIEGMPQQYDTEVGERGVQLSGGQKQRIAIARALVRKPKVLLLDEATSALDAESEHLVQAAIDDMLARGKTNRDGVDSSGAMTVLIVAHRLSTVRNADKICVIQDGRVVEEGPHAQLVEKPGGAYAALIHRQMEAQQKLENGETATQVDPSEE